MKLTKVQIERHLKQKKLAPIYVICSDDPFLKQEMCDLIRLSAKEANFTEFSRYFVESGFDWEHFYQSACAISLFAEQRFIDLDLFDTTVPQAASKIIQNYCNTLPAHTLLLVRMGKCDKKTEKTAWFQALEKNGIVISLWPPNKEALPQWIVQRAGQRGLTLHKDAVMFLAENSEGNLLAITQTLEKLVLLKTPDPALKTGTARDDTRTIKVPIEQKILAALLIDEAQFTIYDFVDSLLTEDKSRSLRVLNHLKNEGIEPTLLLWSTTREFRLLATYAQQLSRGTDFKTICQKNRIMERRQSMIYRFLQKHTGDYFGRVLMQAAEIDRIIKGAVPGQPWEAFARLLYVVY